MKLNYTSLQHSVEPVETPEAGGSDLGRRPPRARSSCCRSTATWRRARGRRTARGRVSGSATSRRAGGALPGALSRDVAQLRERGLLAGHVTAGAAYGGEHEAVTTLGALDAAAARASSGTRSSAGPARGYSARPRCTAMAGMAALESAHAALALGSADAVLSAASRASDPRPRHRGLSHHTATVLEPAAGLRCASRCRRSTCRLAHGRARTPGRSTCRACSTLCTLSATTATTWMSRRSSSTAMGAAASRRRRWGARSTRTRCSSPRPLAAGRALAGPRAS